MTQAGITEYTEAVRVRYRSASKKEKGRILDEFTKVVGCHRKSAVRLLRGKKGGDRGRKRGRRREYGSEVVDLLRVAWEATDRLCSNLTNYFLSFLGQLVKNI